jgi:hypothetical protein
LSLPSEGKALDIEASLGKFPRKKLRLINGRPVIGEPSGGYIQSSLDYTVKTRRKNSSARSFLNELKNRKRIKQDNRKRSRLYQRLISGIQFARYRNEKIRFMTLTSSPDSDPSQINRHFENLVKRIRRKFGRNSFEYCKIRTPEGQGGVIHCLFRGVYIPQSWLSDNWNIIHKASIVDIREMYGERGIASYLMGYLGHHSEYHMGFSRRWVFPGFVREWKRIKRYFLRFFYFYGWSFRQSINAAVEHFKKILYWIAIDPFYITSKK